MPAETLLVVDDARDMRDLIAAYILRPQGYQVFTAENATAGLQLFRNVKPDLIISDVHMPDMLGTDLARIVLQERPDLPVILITAENSEALTRQVLHLGVVDFLTKPIDPDELLEAVRRALNLRPATAPAKQSVTSDLSRRLQELETLTNVAHDVTSILDLDEVLTKVVEAAVNLTGAEEGSLLLLDDRTNDLVMRAAKNFDEEFARTFRLPADNSLAGQVVRTGQPLWVDNTQPQKIKTSYLVRSLMYVPLRTHHRIIGVLGVDNRLPDRRLFGDHDLRLLQALSDYAAIAVENARLYLKSETERQQLEAILQETEDAVLVLDVDNHLVRLNATAQVALGLSETDWYQRPIGDVIRRPEITKLVRGHSRLSEITLEDGRVFNAHLTPISGVGRVIVMQDITHLKEIDRIKSEFVATVSHDLRSPLTAILGYVDLIKRAGPVNAMQSEFIARIQNSVHSINTLVTDLLDLGRIEGGFDTQKESVRLETVVREVVETLNPKAQAREQRLTVQVQPLAHPIWANPTRLRQMLSNLLDNALKYTPDRGDVTMRLYPDTDAVVLVISDTGMGIPLADQPYIFDKFFRAANVRGQVEGTGLGLAIVKSIVDNLNGRIWLESAPGAGTTFTIILPIHGKES